MQICLRTFLFAISVLLASAGASLGLAASISAQAFLENNSPVTFGGCSDYHSASTGTVSASCSGSVQLDGLWTGAGVAHATASYNQLKAFTFQDLTILSDNQNAGAYTSSADSAALMNDNIRLPSSYNQPAFVTFSWTAHGIGSGLLNLSWGSGGSCIKVFFDESTQTCTKTQELFPGNSYSLGVVLQAVGDVIFSGSAGNELTVTSDFDHTAFLSGLQLFDASMNPLTGVTLESDSGFNYQAGIINSAPEPRTLLFAAFGILCVLLKKKFRFS
jgi:hypothetical protein